MINEIFTTEALKTAWNEWLTYRKERKLPKYVPTGLRHTISHLETITGKDEAKAVAFINYSMSQNYQGIFPDPNYDKQRTANDSQQPNGTSAARIVALKSWGRTGEGH
jgi:hypothetical protein